MSSPDTHSSEIVSRLGQNAAEVADYLQPGEEIFGFGQGGSESLVMFIRSSTGELVRKVCSEDLASVPWDPDGTGVMTPPSTKGRLQVDYLQGLPEPVQRYYPRVFNVRTKVEPLHDGSGGVRTQLVYDQSLLKGVEVSTFIAQERPSPTVVARLHHEIMRCLAERVHAFRQIPNTSSTIETSYLDKIAARLELSKEAAPQLFSGLTGGDRIFINGQPYANIAKLLSFFRQSVVQEVLEPKYHSLVMGDSNTENVMITQVEDLRRAIHEDPTGFTYDDIGMRFMDPRAIGFKSEGATTVDDRMYDNKPVHNSVGHYDVFHGEHFKIALKTDKEGVAHVDIIEQPGNPYESPYDGQKVFFDYIMSAWKVHSEQFQQDDPNWLLRFAFIMGTHFAAMPPFHFKHEPNGIVKQNVEAQRRAVAIYCEGIRWLNTAQNMVMGKRPELFGLAVPRTALSAREQTRGRLRYLNPKRVGIHFRA